MPDACDSGRPDELPDDRDGRDDHEAGKVTSRAFAAIVIVASAVKPSQVEC